MKDIKIGEAIWAAVDSQDDSILRCARTGRYIISTNRDCVQASVTNGLRYGFGQSCEQIHHERVVIKRLVMSEAQ